MKNNDLTKILNKIYICLIIVIALLFFILISLNYNQSSTNNNTQSEEVSADYDTSKFDNLNTTEAISKIKQGGKQVVFIGRSTCGYCVKYVPVLKQVQEELNFKSIYIDLEKMTESDYNELLKLDNSEEFIKNNFGSTPMTMIFEDGKFKAGQMGYLEATQLTQFFTSNGYKK